MRTPNAIKQVDSMPVSSQEALHYDAIQLFFQSARRVWANFMTADAEIDPDELQAVIRICRLVNGIPLVIELAAGRVQPLSCQEILQEILTGIDLLETEMLNVPDRHRSLRAVFDYSWQRLTPSEQTVFKRLSVFWGGFTRTAARQIARSSPPILMGLVRRSFLQRVSTERYSIHNVLRHYAMEKMDGNSSEVADIKARHCAYYAGFVEQQQDALFAERVVET